MNYSRHREAAQEEKEDEEEEKAGKEEDEAVADAICSSSWLLFHN